MAETVVTGPSTHSQPSRKGKKAWRKNVDITEVQTGLENVRDEIIKGGVVAEKPADELFATDLVGDAEIEKKQQLRPRKPLKAEEILGARSAVPGLEGRKRKAVEIAAPSEKRKKYKAGEYVSHKELQRLRRVADNAAGGVTVEEPSAAHDPWAVVKEEKDARLDFLDSAPPRREPKTLKEAPASLTTNGKHIPHVPKPHAGKSYNPLVDDWSALLTREGEQAVSAEQQRLAEEAAEAERAARAQAEAERVEAQEEREDYGTDYESAWESEWEGIQSGAEDEVHVVAKQPRRKTPAERNKIKARKEREAREKWERKRKEREAQEKKIELIVREMAAARDKAPTTRTLALQTAATAESSDSEIEDSEVVLQRRRFGKLPLPEAPLEVVLPDELEDSLRRLKPEGNLLTDRYRSLLINGKIEMRKRQWQYKQRKTERTEKWSYKDWKLR